MKNQILVKGFHKVFVCKARYFDEMHAAKAYAARLESLDFYNVFIE